MAHIFINEKKILIKNKVSICFTGDIIPHRSVLEGKSKTDLFAYISDEILKHDIAFGNLEGPSAEYKLKYDHYRAFNAPDEFFLNLKKAGFNVLNIANNHIFDCQYKGMKQTLRKLYKFHFFPTGYSVNNKPYMAIISTNNIKIGFLGLTLLLNYSFTNKGITNVCYYRHPRECLKYIEEADKKVDYLIVSAHWGSEYDTNYQKLKNYASAMFKAGADCIIGHHPHILLPLEYQKRKGEYKNIAAYSLGNFIANIGKEYKTYFSSAHEGNARRSMIFSLFLNKIKDRTYTENIKITPVWIHNNYLNYNKLKEKERLIFPVLLKNCPDEYLSSGQKLFELKQIYKSLRQENTSQD